MSQDAAHDFDFEFGRWSVLHRRLKKRLCGCDDWDEFDGTADVRPILGGSGNVEDNVLNLPSGPYRAIALRSYNAATGTWAIWWLDARAPHQLDVPVIGRFEHGVGQFFADDIHEGQPVKLRFQWHPNPSSTPKWNQALSADGGQTWEMNWEMTFHRQK